MFEQKNIKLNVSIIPKNLNIDKNLIFQSITNILDNSYKYSEDNTEITISTKIQNSKYNITFTDQGIGVNEENIDKIFERFFREEKSRSQIGNGLGLSLVRKIIHLHNGDISASNNKPHGLIVEVSLPLH